MSQAAVALGFDAGGQSIKAVAVDAAGQVLASATLPTGESTTVESFAASLVALRDELLPGARVSIGLGVAGVLDRSGALRGSPHLPLLIGSRLGEELSARLGQSACVHNDADCAAVAEGWTGAAQGRDDFLMIAVGTGLGSGLVLGGKLRAGASGYGCELGHMLVAYEGRLCGCGNRGCLEAYISETAARAQVAEASRGLRDRVAARRQAWGGGAAEAVFGLGQDGDEEAEAVASSMVEVLGAAIASAVNTLDLTTVVLGGGIAPGVLARLTRLLAGAQKNLFARPVADLEILAAECGPLAGAVGAARLGMLAR